VIGKRTVVEQNTKTFSDYIAAVRRYKGRMAAIFFLLITISLAVALGMPPVYRSTATILIEQQEIPEDLVRSTITSFADQRIQVINQRVMTRTNLQGIIKKYNLYPEDQKEEPMEVVIMQLRDDIKMNTVSADVVDPRSGRPTQATIAFTVSYESDSPDLAQKVANELVSLYLNENLKSRTEMTARTTSFLEVEADKLSKHISELERLLAKFKEDNGSQLPEYVQLNMNMMDRTERELMEVERSIRAARERNVYLDSQLIQMSPNNASYSQNGERILGPADRLKQLKSELTRKSAVLSKQHPDVVRLQKEIDALEASLQNNKQDSVDLKRTALLAELDVARGSYSADHPDIKRLERELAALDEENDNQATGAGQNSEEEKPDNPAYIQLRTQLETTNIELASLEARQKELTSKLHDYEQRIVQSPQVERQYRELTRDYENAWGKYKELKDKEMEAQLAEVMESERKGERFTLIEPPELPEKPIKPNRIAIAILGLLFSMAGGLGSAAVSEAVDRTVRGRRSVAGLANGPLVITIPYIETTEECRGHRIKKIVFIGGTIMILISITAAIHVFYRPLDVVWYAFSRKLGI
jgi:uncharacterized protein involved in exopolysaccharide biosynthesis